MISEKEYKETIELGYIPTMDITVFFKSIGNAEKGSTEVVGFIYGQYDKEADKDTIMKHIGFLKAEYGA